MKTPEQIADEATDMLDPATHAEWERIRARIVQAIYTDSAERERVSTINEAEAQELHEILSGLIRGLRNGKEYVTEREAERALEIAALIVSDTGGQA